MIQRTLLLSLAALCLSAAPPQPAPQQPPKLVLLIAVDQFRFDYLTRFRKEYTGGLDRLLKTGANYVNANLEHYPTVTALGHSTMLSGATPKNSGIVANEWYDREAGKDVSSVSDDATQLLGGTATIGASPRRMLVTTIGDELKRAKRDTPKVIGISMKDRSAILPAGHMADAAYWFDNKTGDIVSSTYYFPALPAWVQSFNAARPTDKYAGVEWKFDKSLPPTKMPAPGERLAAAVYASPYGNELVEQFAELAISNEKLGQRDSTDLLSVSFSSNDAVGHAVGPDSPQAHDMCLRTDKDLAKLFAYIDKLVGMRRTLVILTADHGVMPVSEQLAKDRIPTGRMKAATIFDPMKQALINRFGPGEWLLKTAGASPYFNRALIAEKKLDPAEVERVAAASIANIPHVARVFTRTQLLNGQIPDDKFDQRVARSYNARRSPDLEIILDPQWLAGATGTSHGVPYNYDTHIPLIFMGPGIKPGRYPRQVALNDLAPTLATILEIETPSGATGTILTEMLP